MTTISIESMETMHQNLQASIKHDLNNFNLELINFDLDIAEYTEWSNDQLTYEYEKTRFYLETYNIYFTQNKLNGLKISPYYIHSSYKWLKNCNVTFEREMNKRNILENNEDCLAW